MKEGNAALRKLKYKKKGIIQILLNYPDITYFFCSIDHTAARPAPRPDKVIANDFVRRGRFYED